MKTIFEKLGITPPPWRIHDLARKGGVDKYKSVGVCVGDSKKPFTGAVKKENAKLMACAPEMLDALINLILYGISYYETKPNRHRMTAEDYYHEEIEVVESATGENWEKIKKLLRSEG